MQMRPTGARMCTCPPACAGTHGRAPVLISGAPAERAPEGAPEGARLPSKAQG